MATSELNTKELFEKLPQDIKEAMYGVDSSETIQSISKKYNLLIDKMGILSEETGLVMLGLTHPKDFIPKLVLRLGVDQTTAKSIAQDVNEQIFKKVRESLMKIHGLGEAPTPLKADVGAKTEKPEVKVEVKVEPKPLEIRPVPPAPPAALPVEPAPLEEKPGMTFTEKSHESIFRTPSEVHEMDGKTLGAESGLKNGGMKELAEAIKKDKADPYRESVE